jgi:D-xylose transport system substrate-binding protein
MSAETLAPSTRRELLRRGAALGLGGASLAAFLAACGTDEKAETSGGAAAVGGLTIGLSLPTLAQRRWGFDRRFVEAHAKKLGHTIVFAAAQDSDTVQASQVENMLSRGIDALILSPVNVSTAAASVRSAKAEDIPVVSYNAIALKSAIDFWVARDNKDVGRIQAQLATKAKPRGKYVIIAGDPGADVAQDKTKGNLEVLKPFVDRGDIEIVSQQFNAAYDPVKGADQLEAALGKAGGKVDAILCTYDGFILSALPVLKEAGLLGSTYLAGEDVFDAAAAGIVDGDVGMSAYTDLEQMAVKAVDAAVALARGEQPASDATFDNGSASVPGSKIDAYAVTKSNMPKFLGDTSWLTVDQVYKNQPRASWPKL